MPFFPKLVEVTSGSYELHLASTVGTIEVDTGEDVTSFTLDRAISTAVPDAQLFDAALAVPVSAVLKGANATVLVFGQQRGSLFDGGSDARGSSNDSIVAHVLHAVLGELTRTPTAREGVPAAAVGRFEVFISCLAVVDDDTCIDLAIPGDPDRSSSRIGSENSSSISSSSSGGGGGGTVSSNRAVGSAICSTETLLACAPPRCSLIGYVGFSMKLIHHQMLRTKGVKQWCCLACL